ARRGRGRAPAVVPPSPRAALRRVLAAADHPGYRAARPGRGPGADRGPAPWCAAGRAAGRTAHRRAGDGRAPAGQRPGAGGYPAGVPGAGGASPGDGGASHRAAGPGYRPGPGVAIAGRGGVARRRPAGPRRPAAVMQVILVPAALVTGLAALVATGGWLWLVIL